MSEVLTKTAVSTSHPKSALKSNDMSAQYSSASKAPQAAPTEIKAGSRVQITGAKFATGENVPSWAKANTYTVNQVNGNRALLAVINSWVALKDLKPLSQAEIERENALAKAKEIGKASGVKGEVDDNKAKAAQYNPNESVFENAVRATWAVETGGNTRQIADIGDGAGLSVGGFQITERWALHAFVLKYQALGGKIAIPDYHDLSLVWFTVQTQENRSDYQRTKGKNTGNLPSMDLWLQEDCSRTWTYKRPSSAGSRYNS